jgi:arylsulfatase A-like enzyme/Tfp pilus assembly protein PilF
MRGVAVGLAALSLVVVGVLVARKGSFAPFGRTRANLLLISIDTLRADRLGSYGYAEADTPRLDALGARGLRFEQATTVAPLTLPAHASLLTGIFPATHGVRDNIGFNLAEQQVTLAETLRGEGYRTGAFLGAFALDSRFGLHQGFDRYFDEFHLSEMKEGDMVSLQRRGDDVVAEALAWLGEDSERPFFALVHLYDPHKPYEAPEPYPSRFSPTPSGAYDAEVAWTDALVGRLLDGVEALDRLEDTLVVAVGDHGESLGAHREEGHGFFLYEAAVQIPLLMAGPGVPSRVVPEQVRIVDVMPTVLDLMSIQAPAGVQGTSLAPLGRGQPLKLLALSESWYPRYHFGWSELRAVRDGRYKLIQAPRRELYDLHTDPRELHNLAAEQPQRADALEQALSAMLEEVTSEDAPRGPSAMDMETEERLQALGYMGSNTSARYLEDRPRGDPKDKIGLYNLLKQAGKASSLGQVDDAIAKVQEALAQDPEIVEAYTLLGMFHEKAGHSEEAMKAHQQALALDLENRGAVFKLALAHKEMGRLEDAEIGLERARELDPRDGRVLWELSDIQMRQKRLDEAEATLRDALALEVKRPKFLLRLGECYNQMERYADAERTLSKALEERPVLPGTHFNLALALEARGQLARAVAEYEAEIAQTPKSFKAAFNLGRLLLRARRPDEARARFRESVDWNPEFGTGHLYLAKSLLDAGKLEEAEEAARKGLARNPEPEQAPLGHYILADIYNRRGRREEAARQIAAARKLERGG